MARLNAFARRLPATVLELSGADETYAWEAVRGPVAFERATLFSGVDSRTIAPKKVARRIQDALSRFNPSVVAIPGWSYTEAIAAVQWCAATKTPSILLSDSTAWDERRQGWKEWIKSRIVSLHSAGFVAGSPHADYLAALGMDPARITLGYDVIDNDYFSRGADEARNSGAVLRAKHHLPAHYFLVSGRFVEKKNLATIVTAYARYRGLASGANEMPWDLVILGDGPLRPQLLEQITELNLDAGVHLPGFKQYPELPEFYGLAGAFIHASTTEQWGLVVNEAMASGLPVLVSNRCGCAQDLVRENHNGFAFDPLNVDELARRMKQVASPELSQDARAMGAASREIIARWGLERFTAGLATAAETALSTPQGPMPWLDRGLLELLVRRRVPAEN